MDPFEFGEDLYNSDFIVNDLKEEHKDALKTPVNSPTKRIRHHSDDLSPSRKKKNIDDNDKLSAKFKYTNWISGNKDRLGRNASNQNS